MMLSFKDWLNAQEDSAIGRAKRAMALGLGPDLPPASLNSRATINPGLFDLIKKKGKDKAKPHDCDKMEPEDCCEDKPKKKRK